MPVVYILWSFLSAEDSGEVGIVQYIYVRGKKSQGYDLCHTVVGERTCSTSVDLHLQLRFGQSTLLPGTGNPAMIVFFY